MLASCQGAIAPDASSIAGQRTARGDALVTVSAGEGIVAAVGDLRSTSAYATLAATASTTSETAERVSSLRPSMDADSLRTAFNKTLRRIKSTPARDSSR